MNTSYDILSEAAKREAEMESAQMPPLTESEFWAATGVARQTIHEGHLVSLDEAESKRFVEALHAVPGKPTLRFSQALNTYQESVVER